MPGTCPRCEKTVYFNEEKIAMGKSYHKSCFSCANKSCNRKLDSGNLTTHDNELYCKICYARLFGPKGYGYGLGAGVLSMDTASDQASNSGSDDRPSDSPPAVQPQANTVAARRPVTSPSNGVAKPNFDNFGNRIDICPRCNKQVYMAEKMMGGGKAWHKMSCFNCKSCHKRLESAKLCEKDGEIYCKTCYAKNWGPSGYGHGINPGVRKIE